MSTSGGGGPGRRRRSIDTRFREAVLKKRIYPADAAGSVDFQQTVCCFQTGAPLQRRRPTVCLLPNRRFFADRLRFKTLIRKVERLCHVSRRGRRQPSQGSGSCPTSPETPPTI